MHTECMTITPTMARELLLANGSNRKLRPNNVDMLAREIRNGRWQLTHQGIALDKDGAILDGQHRLAAIIKADAPVEIMVTRNVPHGAILGVDAGANRTFSDRVHFEGASYSKAQAAMARIIAFGAGDTTVRSYGEITDLIEQHYEALMFARPTAAGSHKPAAVYAVIARAWYSQDRDRLAAFKDVFQLGTASGPEDWAALRLRDHCYSARAGGTTVRKELYGRAETACWLFLNRRPATRLYQAPMELFYLPWEKDAGIQARRRLLWQNRRTPIEAEQTP